MLGTGANVNVTMQPLISTHTHAVAVHICHRKLFHLCFLLCFILSFFVLFQNLFLRFISARRCCRCCWLVFFAHFFEILRLRLLIQLLRATMKNLSNSCFFVFSARLPLNSSLPRKHFSRSPFRFSLKVKIITKLQPKKEQTQRVLR